MNGMTHDDMQALFDAFNRHDIDAVMAYFHDDIVFETVSGPETYGTRIEGKQAVSEQFENTWGTMPDVQWLNGKHYVAEDRIVSESTFVATRPDPTASVFMRTVWIYSRSAMARSWANRHSASSVRPLTPPSATINPAIK